jgi:hypothetical protein
MRIVKISFLTAVLMTISLSLALAADRMPNYNCGKVGKDCTANCDKKADTSKNAKAYQKCLDGCEKAEKDCNNRQDNATGCAETFQSCIKSAKSEKDKEPCRAAYRKCKGD